MALSKFRIRFQTKTKALIKKGFFPSQLPPAFKSEDLGDHWRTLIRTWAVDEYKKLPEARGEYFSVARAGHLRRGITIPNPVIQTYLCQTIGENWSALDEHFKGSTLSLSRPKFSSDAERATEIVSLRELAELRLTKSVGYRYALFTDVARFFPSIYTHAIPRALHTKKVAKSKSRDMSLCGNVIDTLLQRSQERQTIGIPIGPDTSHIVSEIVATSIDALINKNMKTAPVGYRHVDDFFLCFESQAEAYDGLLAIRNALREFELEINSAKTRVIAVEELREDSWVDGIQRITFDSADVGKQRKDLDTFFAYALDASKHGEDAIKYAVKRSSSILVHEANWPFYQAYLLRAAYAAPNALQHVARILITYSLLGYELDKDAMLRFCTAIIRNSAPQEHHSETVWALWLARELKLQIPKAVTELLSRSRNTACAVVALDLREKGQIEGRLDVSGWTSGLNQESLFGPDWLLAYEGVRRAWIKAPKVSLASDKFYSAMHELNISFYDPEAATAALITRIEPDDDNDEVTYEFEVDESDYSA